MQSSRFALPVLVLLVALTLHAALRDIQSSDLARRHQWREVARLRAHFDSVDAELRLPSATWLTPAQRTARATLVGWLREYRDAGSFPRNDRFPDHPVPFFRDSRGVLCAMAYLIDRSGRGDMVARVASTRNNASIPELAGDPALRIWLDSVGLSAAEAARIQPFYGHPPGDSEAGVSADYALTSILVSGASLATIAVNGVAPSRAAGWAGVIAGSAGLIAGAVKLDEAGATDDVALANVAAGGGALGFGLYRLLAPRASEPTDRPDPEPAGVAGNVSITPLLVGVADRPRLGLAVHARF
jgi:hypothetical protein